MPRGDGTGPPNGGGRGRMGGNRPGAGPTGKCVSQIAGKLSLIKEESPVIK